MNKKIENRSHKSIFWWGTALFVLASYLIPSIFRPLWNPDEIRYAAMAFEMSSQGQWIVPHLNGLRYFEKPILDLWVNAFFYQMLADSNIAVRLGSIIAILGCSVLIYQFCNRYWPNSNTANIAVLVFSSNLLVYAVGSYGSLDAMLTLWLAAAMFCLFHALETPTYKWRWYCLAGVLCGLAFLTKGFLAWAIPFIVFVPLSIARKQFIELVKFAPLIITSAILVCIPWGLAVHMQEPDYWRYFFWEEHINRFFAKDAEHGKSFWFFFPIIPLALLPWWFGFKCWLQTGRQLSWLKSNGPLLFVLLWAVLGLLFFSSSRGKLLGYILPLMLPISIMFAVSLNQAIAKGWQLPLLPLAGLLITGAGVLIGLDLSSEPFYQSFEQSNKWIAVSSLVLGAVIASFGLKQKAENRLKYTALAILPFFWVAGAVAPKSAIDHQLPEQFINRLQLNQCQGLYSDKYMAASLTWLKHRTDVNIVGYMGEFDYGLAYADSSHRHLSEVELLQSAKKQNMCVLIRANREVDEAIKNSGLFKLIDTDNSISFYKNF